MPRSSSPRPQGARAAHGAQAGAKSSAQAGAKPNRAGGTHTIRIIGGDWKRTPLPVLDLEGLRPTPDRVRETLFNWLGQRLDGLRCLDLFAGSGALGFEAASRGAERVVMVERNARAAAQLRANQTHLAARTIEVAEADALRLAANLAPGSFDVVFLDPPFGDAALLARSLELAAPLVAPDGWLYVESGESVDPATQPALAGWTVVREGKAGAVRYHLLQRENEE